jgi:MerR family transcriptional regulator/heat shock protein HspR
MGDASSQYPLDSPVIAIGILAQEVGLSVSAVRRYENEGLIISHRAVSGHRLFSHEDVHRVRNIHHMIRDLGLNIEGIRRMQALLPCWDLIPCGEERRRKCRAYCGSEQPCWMSRGDDCACREPSCRECVVYRFGSLCMEDIKGLFREQDDGFRSAGEVIEEFMRQRRRSQEEEN